MNRKIEVAIVCGEYDVSAVQASIDEWFAHNGILLAAMKTQVTSTTTEEDWLWQKECFGKLTTKT